MADATSLRLLAESVVLPPYRALDGVPGFRSRLDRWQLPRFVAAVRDLHATLEKTPLQGHYVMACGLLLGYHREQRVLPWDCWDVDLEVSADALPALRASMPALRAAGWRHRVSWAANDGRLAEVRLYSRFVGLDFFVTYPAGEQVTSFVFDRRGGQWVQAEQRVPATTTQEVDFLGVRWRVPDPVEPVLAAMYGDWRTPDPTWDYLSSPAIVAVEPWTQPRLAFP